MNNPLGVLIEPCVAGGTADPAKDLLDVSRSRRLADADPIEEGLEVPIARRQHVRPLAKSGI